LGLVECLRLAAPRAPAHQDPAITQRLWSIAKAYWLQAGAAATAAQQQLLAAARVAAADRGSPGDSSGSSSSALNGSAVPSLGPLLAGLQAAGMRLSREQLAAAQSLISARQEDAVRQQAWVSALWGLASIGGHLFFQAEVDALAQVREGVLPGTDRRHSLSYKCSCTASACSHVLGALCWHCANGLVTFHAALLE
jgi:hypothetical protein